jgi:hypothetical protein
MQRGQSRPSTYGTAVIDRSFRMRDLVCAASRAVCTVQGLVLLSGHTLGAHEELWDPEDAFHCLYNIELIRGNEEAFYFLEQSLSQALEGAWISRQRIRLLLDCVRYLQPQVTVEVGAFTGSTSLPLAAAWHHVGGGKLFCVDGWSNHLATQHMFEEDPNKQWWSTIDMEAVEQQFDGKLAGWGLTPIVEKMKMASVEAAMTFDQASVDFLILDGDFTHIGALADAQTWLPRVRQGGWILFPNVGVTIGSTQPKKEALRLLLKSCSVAASIEQDGCLLLRKEAL